MPIVWHADLISERFFFQYFEKGHQGTKMHAILHAREKISLFSAPQPVNIQTHGIFAIDIPTMCQLLEFKFPIKIIQ